MAGKVIKQIWQVLDACFQANKAPMTRAQIFAWVAANYPSESFNSSTLYQQLRRSCRNLESARNYRAPKILYCDESSKTYALVDLAPIEVNLADDFDESFDLLSELEGSEDQTDLLVGIEAQLRDYLAKNLSKLEPGLRYWVDTPPSVEFTIGGKRIDILAKDRAGCPVVIELKRGRAYDRVIGQALMYQSLVSNDLGLDRVRVIIVANVIEDELRLAASRQADVKLFEYELSMQLSEVARVVQGEE